jgi:hypothetical protein
LLPKHAPFEKGQRLVLALMEAPGAIPKSSLAFMAARFMEVFDGGSLDTSRSQQNFRVNEPGRWLLDDAIFNQVQEVYAKLENLRNAVLRLQRGCNVELPIGSVPSIAHAMVPTALARLKKQFPDIRMNVGQGVAAARLRHNHCGNGANIARVSR